MTTTLLELLARSRELGFLGPGPVGPHEEHALAFASLIDEPPARALDLGAGGGLPGLVLAARCWPATEWTFLDAQERRTDFLSQAVDELGLGDRVTVITERAEVVGHDPEHRGAYDLVVARSFGSPPVVAECAAPLLRPGGHLVVSEPPGDATDRRWPSSGLALVGLGPATLHRVPADGDGALDRPDAPVVHLVRTTLESPCGARFPRRVGVPTKRPLF